MMIPCIVTLFISYRLFGEFVVEKAGYQKKSVSLTLIAGFLSVHFLGFVIGLFCQSFHVSWNFFFVVLSIVYWSLMVFLLYHYREKIRIWKKEWRSHWRVKVQDHFKNNWFLYVMVIVFSIFSMSNQMAYYYGNYDDSFYIGKIINQVGANALSLEEYINGSLASGNMYDMMRLLNSYEIVYGYFASFFHIGIPFFCRAVMVIHNYILMFILYRSFTELFVERKHAQYSVVVFGLFLWSNAYLTEGWTNSSLKFRIFDAWQMQTAIFYGGSVVRVMAAPALLLFGKDLFAKLSIKKIAFIFMISFAFLSFSAIYIQLALILGMMFILIKCVLLFLEYYKINRKYAIMSCIVFVSLITLLFGSVFSSNLSLLVSEAALSMAQNYKGYHEFLFQSDIIMKFGFVVLVVMLLISKDKLQRSVLFVLCGFYGLVITPIFTNFMTITSFNNFFVSLRSIASLQYMLLVLMAVIMIFCIEKIPIGEIRVMIPVGAVCALVFFVGFVFTHIEKMGSYNYDGAGLDERGYSLKRLVSNPHMMPELVMAVGEYFDELAYGRYTLLSENSITYEGTTLNERLFNMASNRIEICYQKGCDGLKGEDEKKIEQYYNNELTYEEVAGILKAYDIDYLLINGTSKKQEMQQSQKKITRIYEDENDVYYIVELK